MEGIPGKSRESVEYLGPPGGGLDMTFRPDVHIDPRDLDGLDIGDSRTVRITWNGAPFAALVRAHESTFVGRDGRRHYVIGGRKVCAGANVVSVFVMAHKDVTYAVDKDGVRHFLYDFELDHEHVCNVCSACGVPEQRHADIRARKKKQEVTA